MSDFDNDLEGVVANAREKIEIIKDAFESDNPFWSNEDEPTLISMLGSGNIQIKKNITSIRKAWQALKDALETLDEELGDL
jgi:hypothetical protein